MPNQKNDSDAKISEISEVTSQQLALILGLSVRRIQQLTQDGILTTSRRGHFLLGQSVQSYISSIKNEDLSEEDKKTKSDKLKAELAWKSAKARVAETEADELDGKMHRSEDVQKMTEDIVLAVRAALMSLPGRLAVDVAEKTSSEASVIIRKVVYELLEELSRYKYDPCVYEERVRCRRNMETNMNNGEIDD